MTSVGSRERCGKSKQQHVRRKSQTSSSDGLSIHLSLCRVAPAPGVLAPHQDILIATLMTETEGKDQAVVDPMSADTTRGTDGEEQRRS